MFTITLIIHVIITILLIVIILMQAGKGGGLTETFSGVESLFGTKTNVVLVKATTVLAVLFLITCLSLAYMSKMKGRSLIQEQTVPIEETQAVPFTDMETQVDEKIDEVVAEVPVVESEIVEEETKAIEETKEASDQ